MGMSRGFLRRVLMALPFLLAAASGTCAARADVADDWIGFKSLFVAPDGRVVDGGAAGSSSSRGQGIALLCAVAVDDRETFNRVYLWTEANLDTRGDGLFAASWSPEKGVADLRDAGDGDILIAWALARADQKWHAPVLRDRAIRSIHAIRNKLLRSRGGFLVLLPGSSDFEGARAATLNLSYEIFPAFASFRKLDPVPDWTRLAEDGLRLIGKARFGPNGLPTDWIDLDDRGDPVPSPGRPPRFGADAARIPFNLAWGFAGDPDLPGDEAPFLTRWSHDTGSTAPAWIDVSTGAIADMRAGPGLDAMLAAIRTILYHTPQTFPRITPKLDFAAASMVLLGRISLLPSP